MNIRKKYIKLIIMSCIVFFGILLSNNKAEATSATISASSKNANVGDKVTITVSYEACICQLNVTGSNISDSIEFLNANLNNETGSKSYTLDTSTAGTKTVTLKGDITGANRDTQSINKSVTVTVSESNNTGTTTKNTTTTTTNATTTTNNTTTDTTTKEPTFQSANETVYATGDINVRESYSTSSETLGQLEKGESVTRIGIGDNGWSKVTYNGKTAYIKSSLLTTEEPTKSSDKALKTLEITPEGLDPEFDPETTSYTLNVDADVEKLDIIASPNDENATVEISGNDSLVIGDNMVKITVTAEDGTTRTYNIDVKKQDSNTLGLTTLKISGYTLSPKFSSSVYEYKINVLDPNVTNLDISAIANDENATVEISGNTNLQKGENIVVITVTSEDGKEKVIYQIYVNKDAEATASNTNNMILYIGIAVVVLIIIIIIVLIIKHKKKKRVIEEEEPDLDDYSDLYGYSSKSSNSINDENVNKIEMNLDENENNPIMNDDNIDTQNNKTNEPENPYISGNMYESFNDSNKYDDIDNTNQTYKDTYNIQSENENKNSANNNSYDYDDDYTIDDNYKFKRSKGKHSK